MSSSNSPFPLIRRIVTGHNNDGISVVESDERVSSQVVLPILEHGLVWGSEAVPAKDNNLDDDGGKRPLTKEFGIGVRNGVALLYTDLAPGCTAAMGRIYLVLEDGSEQLIEEPGSVVVQRGTIHAWRNPGPEWVRWLAVIVDAEPAVVNGQSLAPVSEISEIKDKGTTANPV